MSRTHAFPVELMGPRTIVSACGQTFRRSELAAVSASEPSCLTCHAFVHEDDDVTAEDKFGTPADNLTMFDHYQQRG